MTLYLKISLPYLSVLLQQFFEELMVCFNLMVKLGISSDLRKKTQ